MAMSTIAAHIQQIIGYLKANVDASGADVAVLPSILDNARRSIYDELASSKALTFDEAGECIKALTESPFSAAVRQEMIDAINQKTGGRKPGRQQGGTRADGQTNFYFQHYLSTSDWATLTDPRKSLDEKLMCMATRAESIGLVNPSEHTQCHVVGVILMTECTGPLLRVDPVHAWTMKKDFKKCVVAVTSKVKLNHYNKIQTYPERPAELDAELREKAYAGYELGKSVLDDAQLHALRTSGSSQYRMWMRK